MCNDGEENHKMDSMIYAKYGCENDKNIIDEIVIYILEDS
jgi:hypothetical protein